MNNRGERYEPSDYRSEAEIMKQRNREIGSKASEVVKIDLKKAKKALYKTIATTLAIGFTTGFITGGATNEAKHNQVPLSKEKYEVAVEDFLDLKDANIEFMDDGSVEITYSDYYKGRPTNYKLNDVDGDAKFENGAARVENNVAGASFSNENGLSAQEAHSQLNAGLAQNISSAN